MFSHTFNVKICPYSRCLVHIVFSTNYCYRCSLNLPAHLCTGTRISKQMHAIPLPLRYASSISQLVSSRKPSSSVNLQTCANMCQYNNMRYASSSHLNSSANRLRLSALSPWPIPNICAYLICLDICQVIYLSLKQICSAQGLLNIFKALVFTVSFFVVVDLFNSLFNKTIVKRP